MWVEMHILCFIIRPVWMNYLNNLIYSPPRHNGLLILILNLTFQGLRLGRQYPLVNLYELEEEFLLTADLPGTRTEDLELTVAGGILTMKGKRDDPAANHRVAFKYYQLGELAKAREHWDLALAADPEFVKAHFNLASVDFREGKNEAAVERGGRLLEVQGVRGEARLHSHGQDAVRGHEHDHRQARLGKRHYGCCLLRCRLASVWKLPDAPLVLAEVGPNGSRGPRRRLPTPRLHL